MAAPKAAFVIMCGGSGTRFWPKSTPDYPKQFLSLAGSSSLLQQTVERIRPLSDWNSIYLCGLERHTPQFKEQLPELTKWVLEPQGRNTAACVALSAIQLLQEGWDEKTAMVVLPADHFIPDSEKIQSLYQEAIRFVQENDALVTLGIRPTHPHTGYGYIRANQGTGARKVSQFLEKPDEATAQKLLDQGDCYWNAGMFIWSLASIRKAFETHQPNIWKTISEASDLKAAYASVEKLPIDTAILEKAENVFMIEADLAWSDLGSWSAVFEHHAKNEKENVTLNGRTLPIDSEGNLVQVDPKTQVALVGVKDLIVVEHEGKLLICHKASDQAIKQVVASLQE